MHRNDFASISVAFPRLAERSNATAHKVAETRSFLAILLLRFGHAAYGDVSTIPSPTKSTRSVHERRNQRDFGLGLLNLASSARNRTRTCQLKRSIASSLPPEIAQRTVIVGMTAERPIVSAVPLLLKTQERSIPPNSAS